MEFFRIRPPRFLMKDKDKSIVMCAHCKRVRMESDKDQTIWAPCVDEQSIIDAMQVSHGICPDCARRYYKEFLDE